METDSLNDGPYEPLIYYTFRPGNAEKLKQSVAEAFADVASPGEGDRDIIVSGSPGCCAECGETHDLFRGKHWLEIAESGHSLQNFGWGGLALLTPQAWRFYLPAYLLVSLGGSESAENAMDCALSALTPWSPAGLSELSGVIDYVKLSADWFSERAFSFSVAQTESLAAYMEAVSLSDLEDKDYTNLAAYWKERAAEARAKRYPPE